MRIKKFQITVSSLLLLCISCTVFAQTKIKISSSNIKSFKQVSTSPVLACYLRRYTLGTLNTSKIKPGSFWTLQTLAKINQEISLLQKQIKKAKNKRKLKATLLIKIKLKNSLIKSAVKCKSPVVAPSPTPTPTPELPPGEQFLGDPNSLAQYKDKLTEDEVNHILKKVAFGGNPALFEIGKNQGLTALVNALVDGDDQEEVLMSRAMEFGSKGFYYREEHPDYAIYTPEVLRAAQVYRFIYSPKPFKEWMLLNLSGHFSVNLNRIGFAYSDYSHIGMREHWNLLINNSLGNFKQLALSMLEDKAMNFWLDNKDNHNDAPNQNFARELLELFILGRSDPVTHIPNYSEDSVIASTGFLSGFYEDAVLYPAINDYVLKISYESSLHDNTARSVFSSTNQTFTPAGFINYVFNNHQGSPRFVAERFAGMMLYPGLPENIVSELASILKTNNYELKPIYRKILMSQAFFSLTSKDSCFSSPLEYLITFARKVFPANLTTTGESGQRAFYALLNIADQASLSGQTLFEPPSVFGWKGSCNINRNSSLAAGEGWIKTQRILNRINACSEILNGLDWYGTDLMQTLGLSTNAKPAEIVKHLAKKLTNQSLLPQEENLLVTYLRTFRGDDYSYVEDPDLSQEWIVMDKIPRTVCLIYGLNFNSLR